MGFAKILHSIYGKRLGMSRGGSLILDGRDVISNKYDLGSSVWWYDHFLGPTLSNGAYTLLKGSDGSATNPAIHAAANGRARLTTASAGAASMAVGGCELAAELNWEPDKGNLLFGAAMNLSTLTNMSVFAGLNSVKTLQAALTMSGTTVTANASDAVGFLLDNGATAGTTWKCVSVKASGSPQLIETGIVHTPGTDDVLSMDVDASGNATFYINGVLVGTITGAVTSSTSVQYTEVFSAWVRTTAAANTVDIDFVYVEQSRS